MKYYYNNLKKIIIKLIINPKNIVADDEIIHYDSNLLNILYFSFFIIVGGMFTFQAFVSLRFSIPMVLIATIVYIAIEAILTKELSVLGYYIVFKWVGKIHVNYIELRLTLFPIIFISSVVSIIFKGTFHNIPILANTINLLIDMWVNYIIILILHYRYKRNIKTTFLTIALPILFSISVVLWMFLK